MDSITIDGMDEDTFRHTVEDMLRSDQVDDAVEQLRGLIAPFACEGGILPPRFLEITSADVEFGGWERLESRLANHDRPNFPISAIGVVLADARVLGGPGPRGGRLTPFIKTFYFTDDAYPFTEASREDLLDGYTREGFGWQSDYQATDATLSIRGIDDLHGAIIELEDRLLDCANPSEDELRAGTIGACYLAALIHQSLRDTIRSRTLPRPLCVLAACDGVYPFFDAPVVGSEDCVIEAPAPAPAAEAADSDDVWPNELEGASPLGAEGEAGSGEGSLLSLTLRKGTKQLALVLADEDAEAAARFTEEASAQRLVMDDDNALKGLFHGVPVAELSAEQAAEPLWTGDEAALMPSPEPEAAESEAAEEPEEVLEPEPEVYTPVTYYTPMDAREEFRLAEQRAAFPTGTALRQRLGVAETAGPPPSPSLLSRAMDWLRQKLRRG